MEEQDCYCCCMGEQDLCRRSTVLQLLHRKETQLLRLVWFVAAGLLLLVSMVLAFLLILVFGGRFQSPDCQRIIHADGHSSAISAKQQQFEESGNPSALLTALSTGTKYLQWEHEQGNAYLHGGFNYSDGDLVVPRNGNYRVYLQITYENPTDPSCDGVGLWLTHWVYNFKQSYKRDVALLSSAETVSCDMKRWNKSLYTAAVFYLEANDRLRVLSQHPELIVWKEHQMFFGANLEH